MINICPESKCSGCSACMNICPQAAISMIENNVAEIHPFIDTHKCINCGLCKKVCPQNTVYENKTSQKCYAAYSKSFQERVDSASGGIASLLQKFFLTNDDSVCYGVVWDNEYNAIYIRNTDTDSIDKFRGSKYVQSEIRMILKNVEEDLRNSKNVLFIGLPCHVAGMLNFLNIKQVDCSRLIAVDLLCHGVSPSKYLKDELQYVKKKYSILNIDNITFRSNRKFRSFHICIDGTRKDGKKYCYNKYSESDFYFRGFLQSGITLRESCYQCKFANSYRISDISLGDFIGLGKDPKYSEYTSNQKNISLVLCNSLKGCELYKNIEKDLCTNEREINEALEYCPALKEAYKKGKNRDLFIKAYIKTQDFTESAKIAYGTEIKKSQKKYWIKERIISFLTNVIRKY